MIDVKVIAVALMKYKNCDVKNENKRSFYCNRRNLRRKPQLLLIARGIYKMDKNFTNGNFNIDKL